MDGRTSGYRSASVNAPVGRFQLVAARLPVRQTQGREHLLVGAATGDHGSEHAP